jgi:DNA mismatch repair protein MutH
MSPWLQNRLKLARILPLVEAGSELAMNIIRPPETTEELMRRAQSLCGLSLNEVAAKLSWPVPQSQTYAKGWIGQLLEAALGANGGSQAIHDFTQLGIELKSLPIADNGYARESTYVCTTPLTDLVNSTWSKSWIARKLQQVLWIPVEAFQDQPMACRRVGQAILWQPDDRDTAALRADWEELMEMIALGRINEISAHLGQFLQIRPKAANAQARRLGVNTDGQNSLTLPRGFYLRPQFTRQILDKHLYQISSR